MLKVLSSCHLLVIFEMTDWFCHVERKEYYTTCLRERRNPIPDIQNLIFNTMSLKNPYEIPISMDFIVDRLELLSIIYEKSGKYRVSIAMVVLFLVLVFFWSSYYKLKPWNLVSVNTQMFPEINFDLLHPQTIYYNISIISCLEFWEPLVTKRTVRANAANGFW